MLNRTLAGLSPFSDSTVCIIVRPVLYLFFIFLYIIKTLPDLLLVTAVSSFFHIKKNLWLFPLAQLVYPFYSVFTALASLTGKHSWKGRRY